jgi:hypothetical protein
VHDVMLGIEVGESTESCFCDLAQHIHPDWTKLA